MGIQERKEREFKRREQEILAAALALFNEDNWQSVTVEQIAQKAEIGKGTVYKHFDSKDEIYARLAIDFHNGLIYELQQLDPDLDVINRLRTMIRVFWEGHMKSREYHRVVMYCARDDFRRCVKEATRQEFEAIDAAYAEIVYPPIEQGIEEGLFPRKSAQLLIFPASAAMKGAIMMAWGSCSTDFDFKPELEELTNFILAGLIYQDRRF